MSGGYTYDKESVRLRKVRTSVWKKVRRAVLFFVASLSMAVLYYAVFALFFSTDTERRLKMENDMYRSELPELERKERLLADVVDGLKARDNRIYEEIFHTSAPEMNPMSAVEFLDGLDSIPDDNIVRYAEKKLMSLDRSAAAVEDNFRRIMAAVTDSGFVMPPMTNPLDDFTFAQTGASVGSKINPFYKVPMPHNGLDLLAHSGEPVHSAADGVVTEVVRSRKGLGNVVVVDHGGGYRTRYAHLADIEVVRGRVVKRGTRLGYVGVSGNSFAPHLHYEVLKDTLVLDPVNHMFASMTPEEYMNTLILSVSTGQSMD
ncbi:MAG: peptidoglycan DD-metalloendopeptidase family protein [Bacteroidales bacterium]|nr:M23 family metallopeptidase [Bacteroidales bacterium]MBQ2919021.1 peptidoglycan DD-metalloendopeptidase family protein [Bacteroidales bacterium]